MQIALLILKILLMTLLIVLGILLLLLLLVLFVPIVYQVEAKMHGEPDVKVRLSWMSFFLDFRANYQQKQFFYYLRSFFVMLATNDESKQPIVKQKKKKEKKSTAKNTAKPLDNKELDSLLDNWEKTEQVEAVEEQQKKWSVWDVIRIFFRALEFIFTFPANLVQTIYKIWCKMREVFDNVKAVLDKLQNTLSDINRKKNQLLRLYELPTTKTAIGNCKGYLLKLLCRLKPKKITGDVTIGLADPATTGQLFGVFGILLPLYYKNFSFTPDFDRQVIDGEVFMKGSITIAFLLWWLLKIYLDKHTMKTFERLKKILGGKNNGK